jgi:VWFA-related protein
MIPPHWSSLFRHAALFLTAVTVGWAQNGAPQAGAKPQQSPETTPVFRTNADLVLVDVVVREKGKPVEGLKASDFHVSEDGTEQKVTVFEEHKVTEAVQASRGPVLPAHVYSNFPQYAIASAANVLLLDALNTPISDQKYARLQMVKYLHKIPAWTRIAVFTLGSRLQMIRGFTTDQGAIDQAIGGKRGGAQTSPVAADPLDASASGLMNFGAEGPAETALALDSFSKESENFGADVRVRMTIAALEQLGRFLSAMPGRKNLIWFSASFPINMDPDISHGDTGEVLNYGPAVREMDEQLARARVAVYPVDARALMTLPNANPANDPGGGQTLTLQNAVAGAMASDLRQPQQWWSSHLTMDQMAEETGGKAYYDTNAVGQVVQSAIADGSSYYTLGYVPANRNYNGGYRKVAVQVEECRCELSYRRGYDAVDPAKQDAAQGGKLSLLSAAMLNGLPPLSQVIFEARVLPVGDPALRGAAAAAGPAGKPDQPLKAPVTRYMVDYSIDPHHLALKELPDGRRQAELEVAQAVYDLDGKRVNYRDAGLEVNLTAQQLARAMQLGIPIHQEVDVPAGQVSLRMGVRDAASGRIGTLEVAAGTGNQAAR